MTATLAQIRELQGLVAKANAALTPLAADGEGRDCHGGTIRNPDALKEAFASIHAASRLAHQVQPKRVLCLQEELAQSA